MKKEIGTEQTRKNIKTPITEKGKKGMGEKESAKNNGKNDNTKESIKSNPIKNKKRKKIRPGWIIFFTVLALLIIFISFLLYIPGDIRKLQQEKIQLGVFDIMKIIAYQSKIFNVELDSEIMNKLALYVIQNNLKDDEFNFYGYKKDLKGITIQNSNFRINDQNIEFKGYAHYKFIPFYCMTSFQTSVEQVGDLIVVHLKADKFKIGALSVHPRLAYLILKLTGIFSNGEKYALSYDKKVIADIKTKISAFDMLNLSVENSKIYLKFKLSKKSELKLDNEMDVAKLFFRTGPK